MLLSMLFLDHLYNDIPGNYSLTKYTLCHLHRLSGVYTFTLVLQLYFMHTANKDQKVMKYSLFNRLRKQTDK